MGWELGLTPPQAARADSSSADAQRSLARFLQDQSSSCSLLRAQLGNSTRAKERGMVSIKCCGQERAENPAGAMQGRCPQLIPQPRPCLNGDVGPPHHLNTHQPPPKNPAAVLHILLCHQLMWPACQKSFNSLHQLQFISSSFGDLQVQPK